MSLLRFYLNYVTTKISPLHTFFGGTQVTFRRWLFDELRVWCNNILHDTTTFLLSDNDDTVIWNIGNKGRFMVKSVYDAFLWLLANDAILTRDNLRKRKWQGDPSCVFCDSLETVSHLFFQCPVAKIIWVVVAKCFGASNVPINLEQCWLWCEQWFPFGRKFHPWGIASICWAIWKLRKKYRRETFAKSVGNNMSCMCAHGVLVTFICRDG